MTDTRTIVLGDRSFDVPPLPLRICREVYPLCRELSTGDFIQRWLDANGSILAVTDDEMVMLEKIAFGGARAADPTLTQEQFDEMPVTPVQLLDAFVPIRAQTGVWVAPAQSDDQPGEAKGA